MRSIKCFITTVVSVSISSKILLYIKKIEDQKARYDLHENEEDNEGYRAYFQRFLDFVLPAVRKPENALDFGCGESSLLASMLEEEGIAL